ncbi:flagellar export protein FliJ [Azohydromonas caseinilytica]|uniref:Flagellar FliJ protein n=1 Tax=Azohydromonas caseinilytica TaxID=2728836 RepID=A0A848F642_9BURK|nr:flagellar export protein FliJ [Azohydromonas caseinilytica]NML14862.1 flagellar export protein FliJ [Azohydromonas caseinilytica]
MSELRSLHTLLELEERRRDQALAHLRQVQSRLQQAQAQAEQLDQYRGDYQQRWSAQFSTAGTDMATLQCYQSFGDRLEQAVTQQEHIRNLAQTQFDRARQALLAQETRVAAVSKLIARRQAQARLAEDRREQKRNDEAAGRTAGLGSWNHPSGALA